MCRVRCESVCYSQHSRTRVYPLGSRVYLAYAFGSKNKQIKQANQNIFSKCSAAGGIYTQFQNCECRSIECCSNQHRETKRKRESEEVTGTVCWWETERPGKKEWEREREWRNVRDTATHLQFWLAPSRVSLALAIHLFMGVWLKYFCRIFHALFPCTQQYQANRCGAARATRSM